MDKLPLVYWISVPGSVADPGLLEHSTLRSRVHEYVGVLVADVVPFFSTGMWYMDAPIQHLVAWCVLQTLLCLLVWRVAMAEV